MILPNFASSATSNMEYVVEFQRDQISKTLLKILEKNPPFFLNHDFSFGTWIISKEATIELIE
jgi:hypothetical protein